ncbi:ribbon-helix-helix protein, CopG family [Leifsonia bigeumensis]|uniref:Ribbon-helix-helix protein, CopG family n=1 Tax=Leifsonella bigeumensis TaxID=433643 RepID=A0ABP7FFE4_9MICO
MKTAISVPDELFARVDDAAARTGMSRSAFFSAAAERYLAALRDDDLTTRIDAAIATVGDPRDEAVIRHNNAWLAAETETEHW